jgi:hypothetical protein
MQMTFDWNDSVLSIQAIREHTKTTDIKTVYDSQLLLYRAAAIEQAQLYTGLLIGPVRTISQTVNIGTDAVYLDWPARDVIYWSNGNSNGAVRVGLNERRVKITNLTAEIFCGCGSESYTLQYDSGFTCPAEIPFSILLGCLKFIAWNVKNPGDELITMRSGLSSSRAASARGIGGTNDAVMASGAQELWAKYRPVVL